MDAWVDACAACRWRRPGGGWPIDPYVGRIVADKYRVQDRLGAGGMAAVFLAIQRQDGRDVGPVVLKFLHTELAKTSSIRRRFCNEARVVSGLASPHLVKVFDVGVDADDTPFLVMEYLEGATLNQLLGKCGRFSPSRAVDIATQVASALDECHQKGIIHRDLKPSNVFLLDSDQEGRKAFVKVIDFGIARVPTPGQSASRSILGTPGYLAPEQLLGRELDARVDIYGLGTILFEMLVGTPPFRAPTAMEHVRLTLEATPPRVGDIVPDCAHGLADLVARMLAKTPDERPASMSDVCRILQSM